MVDATVDDNRSLLDPLALHHLCFPDADNENVCFAHLDGRVMNVGKFGLSFYAEMRTQDE